MAIVSIASADKNLKVLRDTFAKKDADVQVVFKNGILGIGRIFLRKLKLLKLLARSLSLFGKVYLL